MKKWLKGLLTCACGCTLVLTGCATVSNITNNETGIIYNGGSVVSVGDYLYFANGFASGTDSYSTSSNGEYKTAQKYSYLSRIKKDAALEQYTSSSEVKKVNSRIAGFSNMYSFVCGNYIYYATPNLHKTSSNTHIWTYVSIFRCKLNGDDNKELYTTESYDSAKAQIVALEYNNKNYLVIYDGTNLVKITLGAKVSTKVLSKNVTSIALPEEGETWDGNIFFTKEKENSNVGGNLVCKVNIDTESEKVYTGANTNTYAFVGRTENDLYYTITPTIGTAETYKLTSVEIGENSFYSLGERFYAGTLSDIKKVGNGNAGEGIICSSNASGNDVIMYYKESTAAWEDNFITDSSEVLFVFGDIVYYSTDSAITSININYEGGTHQKITVVSMTIKSGYAGYDYNYEEGEISSLANIYFYAQRDYSSEQEEDENFDSSDTNYYLYSIDANGSGTAKLVGKTL